MHTKPPRNYMFFAVAIVSGFSAIAAGCASEGESSVSDSANDIAAETPPFVATNAFWYYADVEAASDFYTRTLGLNVAADYGFAKILQIGSSSFLTLVDESMGMHSSDEPKTVALALITDQLDEWWDYLSAQGVEMRGEYTPRDGSAHDGFVAYDPEGYYLEFERFNPHPENERFLPVLDEAETLLATDESEVPEGLGFKATVLWLYYRDMPATKRFWGQDVGLDMVADQGWAQIYQASPTGFIGPVDETRGMHDFTEDKAVTVSLWTNELESWFDRANAGLLEMRSEAIESGNPRYLAFVGYDPEGYYVEFDTFREHEDNEGLIDLFQR